MMSFSIAQIVDYLKSEDPEVHDFLLEKADRRRLENRGRAVYFRGLIEYSNICSQNCYYCGLRRDNGLIKRYHLERDEIINLAMQAYNAGYQSICLQAGQVSSRKEIDFVADVVAAIKKLSESKGQGLGITLSLGELYYQQYQGMFTITAYPNVGISIKLGTTYL
jgi:biotin synthase